MDVRPEKGQTTYKFGQTLMDHPFKCVMVGKSPAGKTTVLLGAILAKHSPYPKFFKKNIFIVCPTIKDDKRWKTTLKRLKIPEEQILDRWDDKFIKDKVKKHVDVKRLPTLLILDDCIPIPGPLKNRHYFHSVFTRGRHWGNDAGLSIIVTTQFYRSLRPIVRSNLTNLLVWHNSDKETTKVFEEHSSALSRKDWYDLFYHAVRQKYSFLHINYGAPSLEEGRMCLRFEKILLPDHRNVEEESS